MTSDGAINSAVRPNATRTGYRIIGRPPLECQTFMIRQVAINAVQWPRAVDEGAETGDRRPEAGGRMNDVCWASAGGLCRKAAADSP